MRVSLLGLGILAYWLALSPSVVAIEPSVCSDFRQEMSPGTYSHDDLLPLYPAALRQLGYLVYRSHMDTFKLKTEHYGVARQELYSNYHHSPVAHSDGLSIVDEKLETFKSLPAETTPTAPMNDNMQDAVDNLGFKYSVHHFVQLVIGLPEKSAKRIMVD
ncbi:hypothetical protein IWQ61_003049 [Dispira simplex]|nr:hypothetical protein IWQ61_003049 [Dispira simplex]